MKAKRIAQIIANLADSERAWLRARFAAHLQRMWFPEVMDEFSVLQRYIASDTHCIVFDGAQSNEIIDQLCSEAGGALETDVARKIWRTYARRTEEVQRWMDSPNAGIAKRKQGEAALEWATAFAEALSPEAFAMMNARLAAPPEQDEAPT